MRTVNQSVTNYCRYFLLKTVHIGSGTGCEVENSPTYSAEVRNDWIWRALGQINVLSFPPDLEVEVLVSVLPVFGRSRFQISVRRRDIWTEVYVSAIMTSWQVSV
jgi:hypothetical protein